MAGNGAAETPRRIAVGVYFNEGTRYCPSDEQAFAELQQQTGRLAKVYLNFQSWTEEWNQFSTRLGDNSLKHGGVFMVVWMPARGEDGPGRSDPGWSCKAVAAGQHDAYIKHYAADVKAWGKPLMIRLAHEMNGSWYPYGTAFDPPGVRHNKNAPADYVAMWRHIWAIFHDAGAENVTWVWSPNIFYINANNSLAQQQADYRAVSGRWLRGLDRPGRLLQRRQGQVEDISRVVRRLVPRDHGDCREAADDRRVCLLGSGGAAGDQQGGLDQADLPGRYSRPLPENRAGQLVQPGQNEAGRN